MIFISAQPDEDYFVWQLRVQILNLQTIGFKDEYHICVKAMHDTYVNPNFIALMQEFRGTNFKFFFYFDHRPDWGLYLPSLRPYILAQHFNIYSYNEFFYIDSDIIFRELPDFNLLPNHHWVSDTVSYVGGEYILSKSWTLLKNMCAIVGISPEIVLRRNKHSGGAQYVMRNITSEFWQKVEKDCINLYLYMTDFNHTYNGHGIQSWTADMWAVLWNLWLSDLECKVSPELEFCWPGDTLDRWEQTKIMHNAGVTSKDEHRLFYKGKYLATSPIGVDFSYVEKDKCSVKYVEYIQLCHNLEKKRLDKQEASLVLQKLLDTMTE